MKWWLIYVIKKFCPWLWFYKVSSWDGCPGVCHMPCNWDTEVLSFNKVLILITPCSPYWLMTRSTATWVWTATDAGWATTVCPSSLVDVLPLQVLWLRRIIWKLRMTKTMKLTQTTSLDWWRVPKNGAGGYFLFAVQQVDKILRWKKNE